MDPDALKGFFSRHYLTILFYFGVVLFVFLNRKRFEFHLKIIALYKTNWGIKLMDRIASRHRELVKLFGYVSIGAGFIGMFLMVILLLYTLYLFFAVYNDDALVGPLLPGIRVPGAHPSLFVPLVQGILSIFIVAAIHEFAHGVVARAHGITVKRTGIAIIGPFFAAFVEPDEKELKKRDDVTKYSLFAAGSASNLLTFSILLFAVSPLLLMASNAFYPPAGISFPSIHEDSPAAEAGLETGVIYDTLNGKEVLSTSDFTMAFQRVDPGEVITLANSETAYKVKTGSRPGDSARAYLGVDIYNHFHGEDSLLYKVVNWIRELIVLIAFLSVAIGLANLLPVGPIDGGKMFQQALQKIRGEQKGNRALVQISLVLIIVILFLMTPIFRELIKLLLKLLGLLLNLFY